MLPFTPHALKPTSLTGLQDIALLDLDAMKTFERAQFIEHQNIRRVEAAKALESSMEKVGAVVQRVCAHVTGLPKAAEVAESPLDKMFGGAGDKGKSLVALKEEAAERRRMLQRASQEAGALEGFAGVFTFQYPGGCSVRRKCHYCLFPDPVRPPHPHFLLSL